MNYDTFEPVGQRVPFVDTPSVGGEISKGFSRGLRSQGSGLLEAGALGAEALNLPAAQQYLRAKAKNLRDESASPQFAAEAPTFDEAQGFGQTLRWGAGKVGELGPALGTAVGGALIAKNPFIGGTMAQAPISVGDISQRQLEDPSMAAQPVGERGLRALGGGIADAGVTNLAFGKLMPGMASASSNTIMGALGKNVGQGAVTGGVGMAGGETIKQLATNPDAALDTDAITDAGIGGAVTVGAMHVPVAAAGYMKGNGQAIGDSLSAARTSINDRVATTRGRLSAAKDSVVETPAVQKVSSFADDLGDRINEMVSKGREKYDDVADKITNGDVLGTTKEAIAGMTPERVKEAMDFSDNETVKTVTKWGTNMLDKAGLDDAKRAEINDALSKATTRAGQVAMAGLKKAADLADVTKQKIDKFASTVKEGYDDHQARAKFKKTTDTVYDVDSREVPDDFTQIGTTKKSDDTSGVRKVILSTLETSGLKSKRPEIFADRDSTNTLTHALGSVIERMQQGRIDSAETASLILLLGDDTASALQSINKAIGDPQKADKFYRALAAARSSQKRNNGLMGKIRSSYLGDPLGPHDLETHVQLLLDHARGMLDHRIGKQDREYATGEAGDYRKPTAEENYINNQFAEYYESQFGENADAIRTAVEKEARVRKGVDESSALDENGNPVDVTATGEAVGEGVTSKDPLAARFGENGSRLEAGGVDSARFGLSKDSADGKNSSLINGKAMTEGNRYVKQHMMDLDAKYNPDKANPKYEVKFEKQPGSEHGHIVVERIEGYSAHEFSINDLESMRLDTTLRSKSPSRIEVGKHIIDAYRVADVMLKKGQKDFEGPGHETSKLQRVNAFKAGIAQLTDQLGQKIDVPDSAVIGKFGGKKLIWGEVQKLVEPTTGDKLRDANSAQVTDLRQQYKEAKDRGASKTVLDTIKEDYKKLIAEHEDVLDSELSRGDDIQTRSVDRPKANVPGAEGREASPVRTNSKATGTTLVDNGVEKEIGPMKPSKDGNIHEAASQIKEKDLVNRSNMDGSPHFVREKIRKEVGEARNALAMTVGDWRDAGEPEALINRAQTLLSNIDKMSAKDARRLTDLAGKSADQAKLTLNNLARTYKDQIVPPKGERIGSVLVPSDAGNQSPMGGAAFRPGKGEKSRNIPAAGDSSDIKNVPGSTQPKNPVTFKDGKAVGTEAPKTNILETAISKRQDYLDNPPEDYSTEKARGIIDWAATQKERVDAEVAKMDADGENPKFDHDRYDKITAMQSDLRLLIKAAKDQIQNDKDMAQADRENGTNLFGGNPDKEGSAPNPKAVAAKKAAFLERAASGDKALIKELSEATDAKGLQRAAEALPPGEALDTVNARLSELIQNPDVAYGLGTKKYSLESTDGNTNDKLGRLVTRLADDRADGFKNVRPEGIASGKIGTDSFGVFGKDFTYYFLHDAGYSHTFVIPDQLIPRLKTELARVSADKRANALQYFAVQHGMYHAERGAFDTFGPRSDYAGGKLAESLGVLRESNGKTASGERLNRIDGVGDRETAKFLATALAYTKHVLGKDELPVNWERITGANKNKKGSGIFSAEATDPLRNNAQDPGVRAAIKDHIQNVLGNSVRTAWASFTHAGEYSHAQGQGLIRLSVHALDPMSTAYHESLHAFFAQLRDGGAKDITSVLEKAASSEHVLAQLKERYKNEPGVLRQLADPEERAAYMYQTWAVDPSFKVSIAAKGVFGKIADMIRNALGLWSNDQRALHIMDYFHSGEYAKSRSSISAVRHALMDSHRSQILDSAKAVAEPLGRLADAVVGTGSARLRDTGLPALNKLADAIKREGTSVGGDQGYIAAQGMEVRQRMSALAGKLAPYTPEMLNDALEGLQKATAPVSAEGRLAARAIKGVLAETRAYMVAAGVDIGNLGPDYFPRVWDTHYISKNQQAFRDMLEPYIRRGDMTGTADQLIRNLINRGGNEFGIETREPGMQFKKERLLTFISHADAAQFMTKDLYGTLSSYITQATRKAEWSRRLGDGKLEAMMSDAKAQGATPEQMKTTEMFLKGIDGTLGDDLNPHARRVMGNMIVYQNMRLLPLAAFSMAIDPNGVMVRGGTLGDAWKTFKRGISEIPQSFGREAKADRATELAELTGVIDSAILSHTMGDMYTQGMVGGTAQKLNNAFFKYNMVEGLNRSFRVGASEAAMRFMARHSDLKESAHSERWMAELGIQKGDIIKTADGRIALTRAEGLTEVQMQRVHMAVNQWVDGAVLRPDAADKPIWMNDPRYALVAHLKQFVFAFQETILKRVVHEFKNGNYTPAMALASYVPVMIAADLMKGMVTSGGGTPDWQAGWDIADYIEYGMQRAGLFGVGQFGLDVAKDIGRGDTGAFSLLGPTIEQARDGVEALAGHKQFGPLILRALPANAVYAHQFGTTDKAPVAHDE